MPWIERKQARALLVNVENISRLTSRAASRLAVRTWLPLLLFWHGGGSVVHSETGSVEGGIIPPVVATAPRIANSSPGNTMAMPVSVLRFEPQVDVQARNTAEGQADISIRGGIFENTGFKIGLAALYDPQTGHYFAEIPVPPAMLAGPRILTGAESALQGFNATAGTVLYEWSQVEQRGEASLAFGEYALRKQSLYQGVVRSPVAAGLTVGVDVEVARSTSDGTVKFGDHDFARLAGRLQVRNRRGETNLFAGYQSKFFGWPNLYTPFGFNETENLQTTLLVAEHRQAYGSGSWRLGGYWRRNKDDYEFNRAVPGASNPFQHSAYTRSLAAEVRHRIPAGEVSAGGLIVGEEITSTSLTFGRYRTRTHTKFSGAVLLDDLRRGKGGLRWTTTLGAVLEDTNRDGAALSPQVVMEVVPRENAGPNWRRAYAQFSRSTQVPTYTALNSNPTAGLFRGNPDLDRERTANWEMGAEWQLHRWALKAAAFARRSRGLADWTFRHGVTARTANPVDLDVTGIEAMATGRWAQLDLAIAYTWLGKSSDFRGAAVDASFYALNFPKHRLTAAVIWRPAPGWELRWDNEFRHQVENQLRRTGGDRALLSTMAVHWIPKRARFVELSLTCENLWDSAFEEVPAVPASRRQLAGGVTIRW